MYYSHYSDEINTSDFQGKKRPLLGKTKTAWKCTGNAKKKWTVAIIESRSYNFGEGQEREEWNIIGSSHRKSNPRSLSWHWIFTLAVFYLPWGFWWPNAPWPSNQRNSGETISFFFWEGRNIASLLGWGCLPPERSFISVHMREDEGVGHPVTWSPLTPENSKSQSSLPHFLKMRVSTPMRCGAVKSQILIFSCPCLKKLFLISYKENI